MGRVLLAALCCLLAGCDRRESKQFRQDAVRQYIRLSVALGEHDPNSLDYYYGPPEWVSDIRAQTPKLSEIKQASLDLLTKLTPQQEFLGSQLRAMAMRVDLLRGVRPSFEEEASALFGLNSVPEPNRARMEEVRKEIGKLLPGSGPLAERYAAFDRQFIIPEQKIPAVIARAVQGCREKTLANLRLPQGEGVKIEYVGDRPWNAYSRYLGKYQSLIQVNADFAMTVDRALQLACHEGYPGHHAYNSMQDLQLVQGEGRTELLVQPVFSPQSLVSEALATYAVEVAFPPEERLAFERNVLLPAAGLEKKGLGEKIDRYLQVNRLVEQLDEEQPPIARDYLNGTLEWARADSALEDRALMAHTEATLKYLNEFRTYMLTYTVGTDMARKCLDHEAGASRWKKYEQLITWRLRLQDCGK